MSLHPIVASADAPRALSTERLSLSVPQPSDAAAILAIAGDRRTVEHNPGDLISNQREAEELVGRWIQHWKQWGLGYWCVREAGHSHVIGYCGVKNMTVQGQPALNLISRYVPEMWGRGYATEAAEAAVAWAETYCDEPIILARVRPDNAASHNVAVKLGFLRDPSMDEDGQDGLDHIYSNRVVARRQAE